MVTQVGGVFISGKKQKPMRWILKNGGKSLFAVLLLAVISALISGSFLLLALVSRQVLDIATKAREGTLLNCSLCLCAIILLQAILNIINANVRIRVLTRLEMKFRQKIFQKLLKKRYTQIKKIHSGEILNRFTSDIDIIVNGIINLFPQFIAMLTQIIGGLIVLFSVDMRFMIVIFMIGIFVLFGSRICSRRFRNLHKEVQRTNGKIRSFLQECIENIVVIKSFVNEHSVLSKLSAYQEDNYKIRKKRTAVSNIANTAVYVIFSAGYYATLIWGALRIAAGQMSVGTVVALLQIVDQIKAPFRSMSGLLTQYYSMLASAERMMELEELEDEEYKEVVDIRQVYESLEAIVLEDVSFAYEDGEQVLKDASIQINKGEFAAITGPSGIGKSTLFKILLNLVKLQEGRCFFKLSDKTYDLDAAMRGMFAYVPQGNMILSGTIRENLLFGNEDITEEEMRYAAKVACISEIIEDFKDGYDTKLGERGVGLSEGQVQRIAIARALLSKAPVLLLDECTSALDSDTEERLMKHLKELKDKTILCVSHKELTIQCCDRNICLNNKKFIEL